MENPLKKEYVVGEHFTDASRKEYVISGKWNYEKYTDYQIIDCKTGEEASFRIIN